MNRTLMNRAVSRFTSGAGLAALLLSSLLLVGLSAQDKQKNKARKKKVPAAMKPVKDVAGLPRILLIGDSISIGYTVAVRELLSLIHI